MPARPCLVRSLQLLDVARDLGQVLTDLHEKPGQLRDILGGILSSPQAKAVLAGIAAMVVRRVMQGSSRTA